MSYLELARDAYERQQTHRLTGTCVLDSAAGKLSAPAQDGLEQCVKSVVSVKSPDGVDAETLEMHLARLHPLIQEGCLRGLHRHLDRVPAEIVRAVIRGADPGHDPDAYHALCQQAGEVVMLASLVDEYRYQLAVLAALDPDGAFRFAAALELCLAHTA